MKAIIIQRCTNRASLEKSETKICGFSVKTPVTLMVVARKGTRRCPPIPG